MREISAEEVETQDEGRNERRKIGLGKINRQEKISSIKMAILIVLKHNENFQGLCVCSSLSLSDTLLLPV